MAGARTLAAALLAAAASAAPTVTVTTPSGPVTGLAFDTHNAFLGVPYGTQERWRPSTVIAPWTAAVDATHDPVGCPQICFTDEPPHICPVAQSEDCLFLNVFAPAVPSAAPREVLVFIHGGNFHDGYVGGYDTNGGLLYDGKVWTNATGSIIVSINYRLGALGFLYGGGAARGTTLEGNYGLGDQITALTWVRENIGAFGGDAARVTVIGQSAGSMSISAHLARPANAGLFSGAIMLSNPFAEPYRGPDQAASIAAAFANFSGCGPNWVFESDWAPLEACLRQKDTATILAASAASEVALLADLTAILQVVVAWGPTKGTPLMPARPLEAFQSGNVLDVPIIIGTTANETVIFVYEALDFPLSELLYEAAVALIVAPAALPALNKLYPLPVPAPADYRTFAAYPLTDGLFLCPTRNATEAMMAAQPARRSGTYVYQYSHLMSWGATMWGSNFTECDNEVCHGSDLPALFLPTEKPDPAFGTYTPGEWALGITMQQYYSNFAATGAPGVPAGGIAWPRYDAKTRQTMNYQTSDAGGLSLLTAVRADYCAFWGKGRAGGAARRAWL